MLARFLKDHPGVEHVKIEDGPGKRLGRLFRNKFWPTLIFLNNDRVMSKSLVQLSGRSARDLNDFCQG